MDSNNVPNENSNRGDNVPLVVVEPSNQDNDHDQDQDQDQDQDENDGSDLNVSISSSSGSSISSSEDDNNAGQMPVRSIEERLASIVICFKCKQAPLSTYYQCSRGNLICGICYSIMMNGASFEDEDEIEMLNNSARCIVAEKLNKNLAHQCYYCGDFVTGKLLKKHYKSCSKFFKKCTYSIFGCTWAGYRCQVDEHTQNCEKRNLIGIEAYDLVTDGKEDKLITKRDLEKLINRKLETEYCVLYKSAFGDLLVPDTYFYVGTFFAKRCSWSVDVIWHPKNADFHGYATINYRVKLCLPIKLRGNVNTVFLEYFAVNPPFCDYITHVQINSMTFSPERHESAETVFIASTAEYCERLLRQSGIQIRIGYN